jgi:hypothetical protein
VTYPYVFYHVSVNDFLTYNSHKELCCFFMFPPGSHTVDTQDHGFMTWLWRMIFRVLLFIVISLETQLKEDLKVILFFYLDMSTYTSSFDWAISIKLKQGKFKLPDFYSLLPFHSWVIYIFCGEYFTLSLYAIILNMHSSRNDLQMIYYMLLYLFCSYLTLFTYKFQRTMKLKLYWQICRFYSCSELKIISFGPSSSIDAHVFLVDRETCIYEKYSNNVSCLYWFYVHVHAFQRIAFLCLLF